MKKCILFLLLSFPAHAGDFLLAGTYTLDKNCEFTIRSEFLGHVLMPAGKITVLEHQLVHNELEGSVPAESLALVFQSHGQTVLALKEGSYEQFNFGPHPIILGEYSPFGSAFLEEFAMTSPNGHNTFAKILVEKTNAGLSLEASHLEMADPEPVFCEMRRH